jgi:hypothetical protein
MYHNKEISKKRVLFSLKILIMDGKLDLLAVWAFSFISFVTMNNVVAVVAIIASVTTIIRNLPYLKSSLQNFIKSLKK